MMWPDVFNAKSENPWQIPVQVAPIPRPEFADNEELKRSYGVALGQGHNSFDAGLQLFGEDTPKALWVSTHWGNDPIVIGAKDAYLISLRKAQKPLDKEELLAEVLENAKCAPDFKDKAALLKLYSEISGFTGPKLSIEANNTINNNQNNVTQIVLVKGTEEKSAPLTIDSSNSKSKILNNGLPNLKLVSGVR